MTYSILKFNLHPFLQSATDIHCISTPSFFFSLYRNCGCYFRFPTVCFLNPILLLTLPVILLSDSRQTLIAACIHNFSSSTVSLPHHSFIFLSLLTISLSLCVCMWFLFLGVIRTALPNMDREVKELYQVLIQAKDMGGQLGGLAGTTTINITLSDVNDNPPRFSKSKNLSLILWQYWINCILENRHS